MVFFGRVPAVFVFMLLLAAVTPVHPEGCEEKGETDPLCIAASRGELETVRRLVGAGTRIDQPGTLGYPPLFWAARMGREPVVRFLVSRRAKLSSPAWPSSPLHGSIGHQGITEYLVSRGADINAVDSLGRSAFVQAIISGHRDAIGLFLRRGANVNKPDSFGRTPLFYAFSPGKEDILRLLVERGAQVNVRDRSGRTALYYPISYGYPDAVSYLLANRADARIVDLEGNTPLHWAIPNTDFRLGETAYGIAFEDNPYVRYRILEILLEHGADPDARNRRGLTPLDLARLSEVPGIIEMLERFVVQEAKAGLLSVSAGSPP